MELLNLHSVFAIIEEASDYRSGYSFVAVEVKVKK